MYRAFNFSAGPSMLPLEVLERAREEICDYNGTGMSVMEMSHRSKPYEAIHERAVQGVRKLMGVPDDYSVLFMQGGASLQFAAVPLNLDTTGKADYLLSGNFAEGAYKEGKRLLNARVAASTKELNYSRVPLADEITLDPDASFVHMTTNNTIFGTCWQDLPETGSVPLAADMSSDILSKPYDVSKFGVIYAGAQKNIGPAGFAVVIVKNSLIREPREGMPAMMCYKTYADSSSMYNTPPTYSIYMASLVFDWLEAQGGVEAIHTHNVEKAALLYDYLDSSPFYTATADKSCRSIMNVTFRTLSAELDTRFVKEAAAQGLCTLAGHRLVGGMRASIYNAMPADGVRALVSFMKDFEERIG